jgi:hypothetical protein
MRTEVDINSECNAIEDLCGIPIRSIRRPDGFPGRQLSSSFDVTNDICTRIGKEGMLTSFHRTHDGVPILH